MLSEACLLYTSDAADELTSVDLGGRRIIKKNFFQAEDGIRDTVGSRGLGDVYKRQKKYNRVYEDWLWGCDRKLAVVVRGLKTTRLLKPYSLAS